MPLIANNPYFSVWSMADRLTDDVPRHWTGTPQSMAGLVRIDGKSYRIIGNEPEEVPAMEQRQVEVLPTRTIYNFEAAGIGLTLIFMTPALPNDLDVMSRPETYVTWTVQSRDGKHHAVSLYFDAYGRQFGPGCGDFANQAGSPDMDEVGRARVRNRKTVSNQHRRMTRVSSRLPVCRLWQMTCVVW